MLWGMVPKKGGGIHFGKSIGNHGISWEYHGDVTGINIFYDPTHFARGSDEIFMN